MELWEYPQDDDEQALMRLLDAEERAGMHDDDNEEDAG